MKTIIQNITKKQAVIETSLITFTIVALVVMFHFFNNF